MLCSVDEEIKDAFLIEPIERRMVGVVYGRTPGDLPHQEPWSVHE